MSRYGGKLQVTDIAILQSEQVLPTARSMLMRQFCETYKDLGYPPLSSLPTFRELTWPMSQDILAVEDPMPAKIGRAHV